MLQESPGRHLIRFGVRNLLFLFPILILFGTSEILLRRSGENLPINQVISQFVSNPDALFDRAFVDQGQPRLKFQSLLLKEPDILVVGSSRVLQFRKEMFDAQADTFYNGGTMVNSVAELEELTQILPDSAMPDVMILGIDFWWLTEEYENFQDLQLRINIEGATDWRARWLANKKLLQHLSRSPEDAVRLWRNEESKAIGISAVLKQIGFRSDGSRLSDLDTDGWKTPHDQNVLNRIATNCCRFSTPVNGLSAERLNTLVRALDWAIANDIAVIGYTPPVTDVIYAAMLDIPEFSSFWDQFNELVPSVFNDRGMPFFSITSPSTIGLTDAYILDGFHPGETLHARLVETLLEDPVAAAMLAGVSGDWTAEMRQRPETTPWFLAE